MSDLVKHMTREELEQAWLACECEQLQSRIQELEAQLKEAQEDNARLTADVKDNNHYREESVIYLDRAEAAEAREQKLREALESLSVGFMQLWDKNRRIKQSLQECEKQGSPEKESVK